MSSKKKNELSLRSRRFRSASNRALNKVILEFDNCQAGKNVLDQALVKLKDDLPCQTRRGVILTQTYQFTKWAIANDKIETILKHLQKRGTSEVKLRKTARNPFRLCMTYLCSHGDRELIPQTIHKWSLSLHYADLHGVEMPHLLGFLYQEGSHEIVRKRYAKLISKIDDQHHQRSPNKTRQTPKTKGGV